MFLCNYIAMAINEWIKNCNKWNNELTAMCILQFGNELMGNHHT